MLITLRLIIWLVLDMSPGWRDGGIGVVDTRVRM